jgi:hypothetical protein
MATLTAAGINCSNGQLDGFYTGTAANNSSFPIGSYILCAQNGTLSSNLNATTAQIYMHTAGAVAVNRAYSTNTGGTKVAIAGTWRSRGCTYTDGCDVSTGMLTQRVA